MNDADEANNYSNCRTLLLFPIHHGARHPRSLAQKLQTHVRRHAHHRWQ
jgi:hypothetical protein